MHEITVPLQLLRGILSGMRSCIIVDESDHYLVNTEIIISADEQKDKDVSRISAVCSINSLTTSSEEAGLKKGHSLICLSVVRMN